MQHSNAHAAPLHTDLGSLEQQIREIDSRLLRLATSMGAAVTPAAQLPAGNALPTGLPREELAKLARAEYKNRRRREQVLDVPDLFADPAWDILLDLYVSRLEGKQISTSSACIASCVPVTTALRWLTALEASGMVRKLADRRDKRRVYVEITDMALERLTRYFEGHSA
jgi:hypothetical protein